jgi:uncharacterized protein (PEP-CTERM system associated)
MNLKLVKLTLSLLYGFSTLLEAGELNIAPSISTSLVHSQNNTETFDESDASILSIEPILITNYKSKRFIGNLSVNHNQIQSDTADVIQSRSFTNYQYSSDISLIEEVLSFGLTGGQSYRSILSSQYFVNDPFLGADGLSKIQNNGANLNLSIPARKYFGLNVNAGLSKVKSDRSTDVDIDAANEVSSSSGNELSNENKTLQISFFQGREFSQLNWNFTSNYQNTNRTNSNDLTTRTMRGDVGLGFFSNFRIVLTGQSEESDFATDTALLDQNPSYDSFGAGFSWVSSLNRSFQVTYNQSNRSRSEKEKENFVAFDLNWRFTNRTSVQASIGKRFYGDSGSFSLNYNTKHLRTRIGYNEEVTTFSRLISNTVDQGVFVCPTDVFSIDDCFQTPTLSYDLEPGEQFANLLQQVPEISEEAILRKSLNASFGLSGRRITSALSFRVSNTEYLESNRKQNSDVITISNSFKAGKKTNFNLSISHASIDEESTGTETKTISSSFGVSRKLGRNMSTNLDFRYLDRNSTNENPDAINRANSNLTDHRLTLKFVYDF